MSLEQAIERRARLGQSFCSYVFKPATGKSGTHFYRAQIRNKSGKISQYSIQTNDTINLSSSRLRSTPRKTTSQKIKQKDQTKLNSRQAKKFLFQTQNNKSIKSTENNVNDQNIKQKQTSKTPLNEKLNKMDQYLVDFYNLRKQPQCKQNKYEFIPKQLIKNRASLSHKTNYHNFMNSKNITIENYRIWTNNQQQKYDDTKTLKKQFDSYQHPQLFQQLSIQDSGYQLPFTKMRMISLHRNQMIQCHVSDKIFSQIPMKQYCYSFNNYSTRIEQNIFYVALSKQKLQQQQYCYTECFFWISKPIKHSQRISTINLILNFYKKCLSSLSINKKWEEVPGKLWIVDFNGKISYVNKQQLRNDEIEYKPQKQTQQQENIRLSIQFQAKNNTNIMSNNNSNIASYRNNNIQDVCLSMFLNSIKRGTFSNQTIINE